MTNPKLEVLYQQREDAIARLFHAWVETSTEDADDDSYEELDKAADALTLVHAVIVAARNPVKQ
jgi:hypothetical protein